MSEYVRLSDFGNRGWPLPKDSWGLAAMFGEDGWCGGCGIPLRAQTGSMIVQIGARSVPEGVWTPNWRQDAQVLSESLAAKVVDRFQVQLIPVELRPPSSRPMQVVPYVTTKPWFDHGALERAVTARHGASGESCSECETWRWYGLVEWEQPPVTRSSDWEGHDVVASPEWFGAGWNSYREVLYRRELAEEILLANPRRAKIIEVGWAISPHTADG